MSLINNSFNMRAFDKAVSILAMIKFVSTNKSIPEDEKLELVQRCLNDNKS